MNLPSIRGHTRPWATSCTSLAIFKDPKSTCLVNYIEIIGHTTDWYVYRHQCAPGYDVGNLAFLGKPIQCIPNLQKTFSPPSQFRVAHQFGLQLSLHYDFNVAKL